MTDKKEYSKHWYNKNKPKLLAKQRQYNKDNKAKIAEYRKSHYKAIPVDISIQQGSFTLFF
jgi:hypothetical protein